MLRYFKFLLSVRCTNMYLKYKITRQKIFDNKFFKTQNKINQKKNSIFHCYFYIHKFLIFLKGRSIMNVRTTKMYVQYLQKWKDKMVENVRTRCSEMYVKNHGKYMCILRLVTRRCCNLLKVITATSLNLPFSGLKAAPFWNFILSIWPRLCVIIYHKEEIIYPLPCCKSYLKNMITLLLLRFIP